MTKEERVPSVIQYIADFAGCGFWRMLFPEFILNMKKSASVSHSQMYFRDLAHYAKTDVIHLQRQGTPHHLQFVEKLVQFRSRLRFRIIYDIDDVIFHEDVPKYNPAYQNIHQEEFRISTQKIMELCDEMTVSTHSLRDYYLEKTSQKNITVIPNYAPQLWLGNHCSEDMLLRNYRKHRKRPRILYSGSPFHFSNTLGGDLPDDFTHVIPTIIETIKDFQWVFVGGIPKALSPYVVRQEIEYHRWQNMEAYPRFLAGLEGSMTIAPLQENRFNYGKSDIKFLEAAALGLPCACQDMITYAIAPIRFKTGQEMVEKIRETLESEESFLAASRDARMRVQPRWLERAENIGKHVDVYTFPYGDPGRKYV
ncbi:MAG: hypothetical protein JSR76_02005 [Verrucomicrobia bacterium]|nr:hypothetical protein [Verrucomicrobiota bacterium]